MCIFAISRLDFRILTILVRIQLRWNSGRLCRYGAHCSFAHGRNELESWMGYNRKIQEAKSEDELSCQTSETTADISRSEIQVPY